MCPNLISLCGIVLLLISCSPAPDNNGQQQPNPPELSEAEQIVQASIAAHGGQDRWQGLTGIKYVKTVTLFDAAGNVETSMKQYHEYVLHPKVSGSISWQSGADSINIIYESDQAYRLVNGQMDSTASPESAKNTFMAAYHVLFQPFLLGGEGVSLAYEGDETLANGSEVHVIRPEYEDSNGDEWWYYIDKASKLVVGYMVFHVDHHAYVLNLAYDDQTPMVMNRHRKSYRSDRARNIEYTRAEYYYEDYEMTFAEASTAM
ncbi:MAG: hypothetical protein AAGA85_22810 [Bacteroidota bacterium]